MTATSAPSIPYRVRQVLASSPALTRSMQAGRALVHFGPWRHAARALIRMQRPPLSEGPARTPSALALNVPQVVRDLRADGVARTGGVSSDMLRPVLALSDDLPPGEYADIHEQPAVRALVLDPNVLDVVRGYLGAEPELLECSVVVGGAEDPTATSMADQRYFHFDFAGWHSLSLFIYLTDTDEESGGHEVVVGTHRRRQVRDAVRPWVPADEIRTRYGDRIRSITGPAGTMFFENTEAFHRRLIMKRRRALLVALYASHRSWLSDGRLAPKYSDYVRSRAGAGTAAPVS